MNVTLSLNVRTDDANFDAICKSFNEFAKTVSVGSMIKLDSETGRPTNKALKAEEIAAITEKLQAQEKEPKAPKAKRIRTANQLAHDAILREQSIARHLALGHTVKTQTVAGPTTKVAKPLPAKKVQTLSDKEVEALVINTTKKAAKKGVKHLG
jgi:hypothetical protein